MTHVAAITYAAMAVIIIAFQFALALGAPWGHLAMGGNWPGTLPNALRVAAVFQALLIASFAWIVLRRADLVTKPDFPKWTMWLVLVFAALAVIANLATPSVPERALWAPIAIVMLTCAVVVKTRT